MTNSIKKWCLLWWEIAYEGNKEGSSMKGTNPNSGTSDKQMQRTKKLQELREQLSKSKREDSLAEHKEQNEG